MTRRKLLVGDQRARCCVPDSMPGPSLMPLAISATPLTTSSKRSSWTKQPGARDAALAVVEEDARWCRALERATRIGVVEDDVWGSGAAELERDLYRICPSPGLQEDLARTFGGAGW